MFGLFSHGKNGLAINQHYKLRYEKFIESLRNQIFDDSEYTEIHHIMPKCLNGNDNPENLIRLSLRQHFLAHWLLWKAYPDYPALASAFLQMNNKNPKTTKPFQGRLTSQTYEKLKIDAYNYISQINKNMVSAIDKQGNRIRITSDEYKLGEYQFHTAGRINVLNKQTNEWEYITTDEYKKNKDKYLTRLSGYISVLNKQTNEWEYITTDEYKKNKDKYLTRLHTVNSDFDQIKFWYIDLDTNQRLKMSKIEARIKNDKLGYKRYKQDIDSIVVLENGDVIPAKEYNPSVHTHKLKNKLPVFDTEEQINKIISIDEYNKNKNRYKTSTSNKVLARNKNGKTILVSKDEFKKGGYVGHTKGLRTVYDKKKGKYVQIDKDEYDRNKDRYQGPNKGKINVIDKITGKRQQIQKSEFNPDIHLPLGNKKYYFRCKNILTGKEKNVNIYEWNLVKHDYEIIDKEKFNDLKHLI